MGDLKPESSNKNPKRSDPSGGGFAKMVLNAQLNEEEMEMARSRAQLGPSLLATGRKDPVDHVAPRNCWQAWCVCWL